MYPDLSYFLYDLFGTQPDNWTSIIKTFGLFLVFAFVASAYVFGLELKRKEAQGLIEPSRVSKVIGQGPQLQEILIQSLIGFVFGAKLLFIFSNFPEFKADPAGVIFSTKGSLLGGILFAAINGGLRYYNANKAKLATPKTVTSVVHPYERVGDITIMAAIFGVLGSKLFSILESFDQFIKDPIGQLFSGSGLTIYGGLILAFVAVYIYVKRKGMKPIHVMDAVAPALIMGYAVGRMGCQFSGDGDWGIVNELAKPGWFIFPDWAWSYDYPNNVIQEGIPIEGCEFQYCNRLDPGRYPTPIYETVLSFIIFSILWVLRKRIKIAGVLFFIYVTLNGLERFFIEGIRVNPRYDVLGMNLSLSQGIAILLFVIGIAGILVLRRRAGKATNAEEP